jgi:transposase-like protein
VELVWPDVRGIDPKEAGCASAQLPQGGWHLDEVFVKINGTLCYLWRAVDHEGEVLETVVTAKRIRWQHSSF